MRSQTSEDHFPQQEGCQAGEFPKRDRLLGTGLRWRSAQRASVAVGSSVKTDLSLLCFPKDAEADKADPD
jgi:hypothetical protein